MASPSPSANSKIVPTGREITGRAPGATPPFPTYPESGNVTAAAANAMAKNNGNLKRTMSLAFLKKVGKVDVGVEATELAAGESSGDVGRKTRKPNSFKDSVVQSISRFKNRNKLNSSSEAENLGKENPNSSGMEAAAPTQSKFSLRFRREKLEEIKKCSEEEIVKLQKIIQKEVDNFLKTKDGFSEDTVVVSKAKYDSLRQQLHDVENLLKQKREEEEEEERKLHSSLDLNEVSMNDEGVPSEKPVELPKTSKRQDAKPKVPAPDVLQFRFPGDDDTDAKENAGADDVDGTIDAEKEGEPVENNYEYVENLDKTAQEFEEIQETSEEFEEITEAVEEFEKIERDFEDIVKVEELPIKQDANDSFDSNWEFLEKDDAKEEKVFVVPSTSYKVPIWDDTGMSSGWRHIGFVEEMEKAQETD